MQAARSLNSPFSFGKDAKQRRRTCVRSILRKQARSLLGTSYQGLGINTELVLIPT